MSLTNILRFISSLFILSAVILSLPAPVRAAGITTNPSSGIVGSTVSIMGEGFTGGLATIYWDENIVARNISISQNGGFDYDFTIPSATRGEHIILVEDDSNWEQSSASFTFTVLPNIVVFPDTAREYNEITINGDGFGSFENDIKILWDGEIQPGIAITADRVGSWHHQFTVPSSDNGNHNISAMSGATTTTEIGSIPFIVFPWATVEPTSGPVGTQLIIKGWGFRTMEDGITITWDNEIIVTNIEAEYDGTLLLDGSKWENDPGRDLEYRESVYVPESSQGKHIVGIYGSSFTPKGILPDTEFTVIPQIEVQPLSGEKGSEITISGTGFAQNVPVDISFHKTVLNTGTITNNIGSFTATVIVPDTTVKENKIVTMDKSGNSAETDFVLEETVSIQAPQLLQPANNTNFTIFSSVGDVFLGTGKYVIGIFDYWRGKGTEVLKPPSFTLDWIDIKQNVNVKYILQVSQDYKFSSYTINKEIQNNSDYTLIKTDAITKGKYYWRVKAIYDAGQESPWSEISEFSVSSMPVRVTILSLVIALLCLAAIVFGIIFLRSNSNRY